MNDDNRTFPAGFDPGDKLYFSSNLPDGEKIGGMPVRKNPEGTDPNAPKIIRLMNMRLSIQAIYFIKTRRVISTAGLDKQSGRWLCALLHFETHKIIVNTKPAFRSKKQALEFGEELIQECRRTKLS